MLRSSSKLIADIQVSWRQSAKRRSSRFLGFCLKDEVNRERLALGDGDFLALRAVGFMPCRKRIFPWSKFRKRESAIFSRYRKMIRLQHDKISLHPGVDVALYRDELRIIVRVRKGRSSRELNLIPLTIASRQGVDIV